MKISLFQVQPFDLPQKIPVDNSKPTQESFSSFLKEKINKVNELQLQADSLTTKMIVGEDVDLHNVMIATEKAELAIQLTLQIRNKLVEAYQEISKMQI